MKADVNNSQANKKTQHTPTKSDFVYPYEEQRSKAEQI